VLTALAALSFNQRSAIVMRELEGRSYQEIAGVLGLSVSAVEALLFRARRNLQVRRRALGVLTTVPLPGSLASFIGGGGGAIVAGSTAIGADLVLKAAAVVALGAATVGAGYKGLQAMTAPPAAPRTAAAAVQPASKPHPTTAATRKPLRRTIAVRRPALRRAVAASNSSQVSRPTGPSGSLPASDPAATLPPPPTPVVPPAALPLPKLPPPPVAVPPPVPTLPVTVTIPPLLPLPPLPPLK
jgi:pyruvate/2-oxoglutarate dehydrogenase complex dihydrolipoamide acyltransferase (E2) component